VAVELVQGLSGSPEGIEKLAGQAAILLPSLLRLVTGSAEISKAALVSLVNLSQVLVFRFYPSALFMWQPVSSPRELPPQVGLVSQSHTGRFQFWPTGMKGAWFGRLFELLSGRVSFTFSPLHFMIGHLHHRQVAGSPCHQSLLRLHPGRCLHAPRAGCHAPVQRHHVAARLHRDAAARF
jgi:hypothetical protein